MLAKPAVNSSVIAERGGTEPPLATAAVIDPPTPAPDLAVAKSATSVQLLPFQDSVFATLVEV